MMIEQAELVQPLACQELRGGNHTASYSARLPGLTAWVSCRPLQPSPRGGDLYYLSACSHGVIARVVLADVSGHGNVVSSAAVRLHDALREHMDDWDQSRLIRTLNDNFFQSTGRAQYATAFLASFYSETGELLFTNAGHPPPLWYRAATRKWDFLSDTTTESKEIRDLPLGMIAGTSYTQTAVQVDPGDLLILYTDGINESSNLSGEQLGLDGLLAMAASLPTNSPSACGKGLRSAVARYRGPVRPDDDQTIVVLQRSQKQV